MSRLASVVYCGQVQMDTASKSPNYNDNLRSQLDVAVRVLANGGVISVPTDTLYGLAASVLEETAIERLFKIKGRMTTAALPLLVGDVNDISNYTEDVPDLAWRLAEMFYPGALTMILTKSEIVPDIVTGGAPTVGIRVPDHEIPRAVSRILGAAITGTSANRTGEPGLISAQDVRTQLGEKLDYVVDGGTCDLGIASTVLDLSGSVPFIIREGAIPLDAIEETCRQIIGRRDSRIA